MKLFVNSIFPPGRLFFFIKLLFINFVEQLPPSWPFSQTATVTALQLHSTHEQKANSEGKRREFPFFVFQKKIKKENPLPVERKNITIFLFSFGVFINGLALTFHHLGTCCFCCCCCCCWLSAAFSTGFSKSFRVLYRYLSGCFVYFPPDFIYL